MKFRVKGEGFDAEGELEQVNLIYGPPSSFKTLLLKSLYFGVSLKESGCLKHRAVALLLSHITEAIKHDKCEQGQVVKCSFEVELELIKSSFKLAIEAVRSSLLLPKVKVFLNGKDPTEPRLEELCNLKLRLGTFSWIRLECEGGKLKGAWSWDQSEEIPFPPDVIAEALLPPSEKEVTYLPLGRSDLAQVKELKGPLHLECFVNTFTFSGSSLEVERKVLRKALNYSWVFLEGALGDQYSLKALKEFLGEALKKGVNIIIESRDERVVEELKGIAKVLETPFK